MNRSRKQRRKKQVGATLVETLIVVPVFAIFLGGGYRIYGMTDARLEALYTARQAVWTDTINGCTDENQMWMRDNFVERLKTLYHPGAASAMMLWDMLAAERARTRTATTESPGSSPDPERPLWVDPGVATESVRMACNETPHDLGTRRSGVQWMRELWLSRWR